MLEVFENVREPIKMLDKGSLFSMLGKIGLCGGLKFTFFFQVNGIVGFGGLNLVFLVTLNELRVQNITYCESYKLVVRTPK
jgi:hypothetical protein